MPARTNALPYPSSGATPWCAASATGWAYSTPDWPGDGVAWGGDGGEHESMTGAWASGISPLILSGDSGMITLIEGSTLCLSSTSGDILPDRSQGLFVSDTRVISGWRVHVDGMAAEPLTTLDGHRYRATFVGRIPPRRGRADSTLMVLRTRYVGDGMREDIVLRNVGAEGLGSSSPWPSTPTSLTCSRSKTAG